MATIATVEGIEKGMLLLGPLSPGEKKHLFVVTRVLDTRRVEAVTHAGYGSVTITMRTAGVTRPDGEWRRVSYRESVSEAKIENAAGVVVKGG